MKVVINKCYGGFGLSDDAIEECIKRGMTVSEDWEDKTDFIKPKEGFGSRYYAPNDDSHAFRSNPTVISVVEEMGDKANGNHAELKVIEIPFDGLTDWEIDEYDGIEHIQPTGERWG